ncbi:ankyrin repeat-containing domain protein [Lasiosphaeria hispida]|uniref:Ankyrin repeat-containing domain protein n=1 Tax=Lasiosphaeria hispida TaxID=260671 RepID=A0AAJ0H9W5_9PEZI|nr:ankyrin repeat-containing domain protein [Lasiosphaeria hispida]
MEVLGTLIAVTNVTISTTSSLWSLCDAWREAPEELHRLLDDLRRSQEFLSETRIGLQSMYPEKSGHQLHPNRDFAALRGLERLLEEGSVVVRQIGDVINRFRTGEDWERLKPEELGKRRRALWLRQTLRVTRLRKKLKNITVSMCRLLVAQNVAMSADIRTSIEQSKSDIMCHVDRRLDSTDTTISLLGEAIYLAQKANMAYINHRFESMEAAMVAAVRDPIREELALLRHNLGHDRQKTTHGAFHETVVGTRASFERRSIPSNLQVASPCQIHCRCACHSGRSFSRWSLTSLSSVLGAMVLTSAGYPAQACTDRRCLNSRGQRPASREVSLVYQFPDWLMRAALSVFYSSNLHGHPEMVIRIFHRLGSGRPSDAHNIFGYIDRDDVEGVKRLLHERRGSIYDVRYARNVSPLFAAAERQKIAMVRVLLQAGADPYQETSDGRSPITCAFQYFLAGSPEGVELVKLLPVFNGLELSPLHMATIGVLHIDLASALPKPEFLPDLNRLAINRYTPLHLAAIRGDAGLIRTLLEAGAHVDKAGPLGKTPLLDACACGHYEASELLLNTCAQIDQRDSFGLTALARAASCSATERRLLALLVDRGADINIRANDLSAPLAHAVAYGCIEAAAFLIDRGADINNSDSMGDTAVTEAVLSGCHAAARLLLSHGSDVRHVNNDGMGILHYLAAGGDVEMMGIFRDARMCGLKRSSGRTPEEFFEERVGLTGELRKAFESLLNSVEYEVDRDEEGRNIESDESDVDEEFVDAMETLGA